MSGTWIKLKLYMTVTARAITCFAEREIANEERISDYLIGEDKMNIKLDIKFINRTVIYKSKRIIIFLFRMLLFENELVT